MTITRTNLSTRSAFEERVGYSRAVKVGDTVFISGTVGLNYDTGTLPDTAAEQMERIAQNIELTITGAGGTMADIVQTIVYVTSPEVFDEIAPILKRAFGPAAPTNTALQVAFPFPGILAEVSATAILGCGKNVELLNLR